MTRSPRRAPAAVLTRARAISMAQLESGSTAHRAEGDADDDQQLFYVASGSGHMQSGATAFDVAPGDTFLLPPRVDFQLVANGDRYLNLYVVTEPSDGADEFSGGVRLIDNAAAPVTQGDWHNREQMLASVADGLQGYTRIDSVELAPMAMSRPYSVMPGSEEVWIAIEADTELLLGKELRTLPAGTAYLVPPTGITAQAHINASAAPARFLRIRR